MKFTNLIRSISIASVFLVITLLNITNQKEKTKLQILIWNTPTLSLGTYLSISTGTGFILSYFITTHLAKTIQSQKSNLSYYKIDNQEEEYEEEEEEPKEKLDLTNTNPYQKTLIERDAKDPSPTMKARFRVIGRKRERNEAYQYNQAQSFEISDYSDEYDNKEFNEQTDYEYNDKKSSSYNDWDDYSYTNW